MTQDSLPSEELSPRVDTLSTSVLRFFGLLLSLLAFLFLPRLSGQSAETGIITGNVSNGATQKVLERATIVVEGTSLSTLSNRDGSYRIVNVPAGEHGLIASYAGLDDGKQTVTVQAGQSAELNFTLSSEVYQMNKLTVAAELEGNAYSIQQQQKAESLRTIVSADAFGTITDANPGEFLKSTPGIQMDYTGIEPRRAFIRGLEPNLNQVMINGNQAAAAASSSTDRAFEFDQITLDNIESIEVFKAPLPSMPANAIGGTINLVTRSAFLQKGRRIRGTVDLTANTVDLTTGRTSGPNDGETRKIVPGGSFMFSDTFLDGRLGVVLSLSRTNVYGNGGTGYDTMTYVSPPATGNYTTSNPLSYVRQYQREDHTNYNERSGASLNLDYKVSADTTAFLRTTFNHHVYLFRNRFFIANNGGSVAPGFSSTFSEALPTTASNSQQSLSFGNKISQAWMINPGAKHVFGPWTINYDVAYSRATNHYDNMGPGYFSGVNIILPNVGYTLRKDNDGTAINQFTQTAGPDVFNLGNYRPNNTNNNFASTSERSATDQITSGKLSARRDFATSLPFYLEGGVNYQKQERSRARPSRRWAYVGPDGILNTADDTTAANLGQFAAVGYKREMAFGERAPDQWISAFKLLDYYRSTPKAFAEDLPYAYEQAFINNQQVKEAIKAAYVMGSLKIGKLDLLAGLRLEETDVSGEGARKQDSKVPLGVDPASLAGMIAKYSRMHVSTNYTPDPFKYLHITYHATKDLQFRASYTEAIGRPNFGNIIPGSTIDDASRTVSLNNTELKPQRARNYDFSVEEYTKTGGYFSAAWFRKDITDYINTNTSVISGPLPEFGLGSEVVGYSLTTQNNLGSAHFEGFEVGFRQQMLMLPPAFRGVEVFANYTHLYKTEGTFGTSATTVITRLPNTAPGFWNIGASYRGLRGKLYLMVKANYVDEIPLNTLPTQLQRENRLVIDGEARYQISSNYEVSLAARNLGNVKEGESEVGHGTRTGTGGGIALALTLGINY